MEPQPDPESFLPLGNLPFRVLLALSEDPAHGYRIGKEVEARSEGRLSPTTGTLYQVLRRLTGEGLIEPAPAPDESTDSRRQYFQLTRLGRAVARSEAHRLNELVLEAQAKRIFGST